MYINIWLKYIFELKKKKTNSIILISLGFKMIKICFPPLTFFWGPPLDPQVSWGGGGGVNKSWEEGGYSFVLSF